METENTIKSVELLGRTFKIVKSGLDTDEVMAFIKELVGERDQLLKRQENLTALTRLYEKTVIEASELAKDIEKEARERVQKEANAILAQAHERAKVMAEQQKAEAAALIQQQLGSIKGTLKQQLDTLLKEEITRVQSTIKEIAKRVSEQMVSQADNLEHYTRDLEIELNRNVVKSILDIELNIKGEKPATGDATRPNAPPAAITGKNEKDIQEIEIMLPRDQDEIANINKALVAAPGIKDVELLTMVDKSVFKVALSKPVDLLTMLRMLPEVYQADTVVKEGHRKILVALTAKARLEQEQDILNGKIKDILVNTKI